MITREAPKTLWTDAEKHVPEECMQVLASDLGTIYVAYWREGRWFDCSTEEEIDCHVTHWTWLPELPEEGGE